MELQKILDKAIVRRIGTNVEYKIYSKSELLLLIGEMSEDEIQDFCKEIIALQHHKDTTVNLYTTDQEPEELLHKFWQRQSDACPLEATEAENQENDFAEWTKDKFFQIEYNN